MKNRLLLVSAFCGLLLTEACRTTNEHTQQQPALPVTEMDSSARISLKNAPPMPEWARNATIYEINTRQFSHDGTFNAIMDHLPRLKELGVDILWFMPIHPISQTNKKGTLGNPYAVSDYKAVNPNYGTINDFKLLVKRAHDLGLRVIIDWVPNHTGLDHPWVKQHPDYYTKVNGKLSPPIDASGKPTNWDDVVDLNYNNTAMRHAMIDAMQFWLRECDIDGFRCDVAGLVPNDFWAEARPELDKVKTVFMLAEWEDEPAHFKSCFNMNYGWGLYTVLKAIAAGARPATSIDTLIEKNRKQFPPWYFQMHFTQNHDANSKGGSLSESFGPGADAFVIITHTLEGMPLVYNGMESNLNRRLNYLEKEQISWLGYGKAGFFRSLLTLKHRNRALWNGLAGGKSVKITTDHDEAVYAFYRQKDNDKIMVVVNLSDQPQLIRLTSEGFEGIYTEIFTRQPTEIKPGMSFSLKPWEYRVYTN